jgi:4-amino-4-deoxy-L-arabinose transferase-like glycosyltransferase
MRQSHEPILTETAARHTHVLALSNNRRPPGIAAAGLLMVIALYLTGLTRMGMVSTDEPRYAAIGRAMAQSGDWITPRLWGEPWFEKPALLYWMTATGFKLGLGDDLAPRLPVALLSVAFLIFFHRRLRGLFDDTVATGATAILATTGGWLAYSHVAVTDIPLAVFFSAAVLYALPLKETPQLTPQPANRVAAAIALGLAVLAKGLPPIVLFLPILTLDYRNWRRWLLSWPIVAFTLVPLPWYVLCTLRNGWSFPYTFFIQHQFDRFRTDALQHVQPFWFYGPVFLLLLFPWFPLLAIAFRRTGRDERTRALAAVVIFGLVFFSLSVNKLPGYVLPLLPGTCALMGVALAATTNRDRWLIAPIALLGAFPLAISIVPHAVATSLHSTPIPWISGVLGLAAATAIGTACAVWLRTRAFSAAIFLAAIGFFLTEIEVFPALDQAASARPLWNASHPECAPFLSRGRLYGLYYYSDKKLPDCAIVDKKAEPINAGQLTH